MWKQLECGFNLPWLQAKVLQRTLLSRSSEECPSVEVASESSSCGLPSFPYDSDVEVQPVRPAQEHRAAGMQGHYCSLTMSGWPLGTVANVLVQVVMHHSPGYDSELCNQSRLKLMREVGSMTLSNDACVFRLELFQSEAFCRYCKFSFHNITNRKKSVISQRDGERVGM